MNHPFDLISHPEGAQRGRVGGRKEKLTPAESEIASVCLVHLGGERTEKTNNQEQKHQVRNAWLLPAQLQEVQGNLMDRQSRLWAS